MKKNIKNSIVADHSSTITNAKNEINSVKTKYTIFGFFLGVLSSVIASYIFEEFIK